ncbi:MAG: hypothetical protein WCT10_01735 [Patescibacteria group bacterium]|jgi:hypothetical protein
MTLRQYVGFMSASTAATWIGVGLILLAVDPDRAHAIIIAIFYLCLWLALVGTLSLGGFAVRYLLLRNDPLITRQVLVSFRQAILLALLLVAALFLQSRALLTTFNSILMIAALTLVEFFFISLSVRR